MVWWMVLAACWIYLGSGPSGLETTIMLAGMIVAGLGFERFLNFYWKLESRRMKPRGMGIWRPREIRLTPEIWDVGRPAQAKPRLMDETREPYLLEAVSRKRRKLAAEID